jgi:hypothetical protein
MIIFSCHALALTFLLHSMRLAVPYPDVLAAYGMSLIASLFTAHPAVDITVSKSHVLFHAPSSREVQDYYIKTTTGIESINPGGIIV